MRLIPLLLLSLLCSAQTDKPALFGDLTPGPDAVGYRQLELHDLSRPDVGDLTRGITAIAGRGRPLSVHIWYPAQPQSGKQMVYGDYITALGNILLRYGVGRSADELFLEQPTDLGGDRQVLESKLPELKRLPMLARAQAAWKPGRFPLVIFPGYRAPATNSVLCEFLASHGYVVATYAMRGTFDLPFNTGRTGIETGADDIAFVRAEVAKLPGVAVDSTALMGVGIQASSALIAAMRNPEIRALISLEGGIPTAFEDTLLKRIASFDPTMFRIPLLGIIVDEEPSVDPVFFDQYKYSERHVIDFKHMREFFFLNYGTMDEIVPGIIGKPPGDTKLGVRIAGEYIRRFLDAYLRGDRTSLRSLTAQPETFGIPGGQVTVSQKSALSEPKSYHELRAMMGRNFEDFRKWYQRVRVSDPQPIPMATAADLSGWLGYAGDQDWTKRLELARIRVEMYPNSSRAVLALAQALRQKESPSEARTQFERVLSLLPEDPDPSLDAATRRRLLQGAKDALVK